MGDYHTYYCDKCGDENPGSESLPRGWQRRGDEDWCDGCIEEEMQDLTAGLEVRA